jgi:hypothetical protein
MANINNSGTSGANQGRINQIGAEIGEALQGFVQGQVGDVGRGLQQVGSPGAAEAEEGGGSGAGAAVAAAPVVVQPQSTIRPSGVIGWADRMRAAEAAQAATMTPAAQVSAKPAEKSVVAPTVQPRNEPTTVSTSDGSVAAGDTSQAATNNLAQEVVSQAVGDSSTVSAGKKWRKKKSTARQEYEDIASRVGPTITDAFALDAARQRMENEEGQQPQRRQVTGRASAPSVPASRPRKETNYEAAERVMNRYEDVRRMEAEDAEIEATELYNLFHQNGSSNVAEMLSRYGLTDESFANMATLPDEQNGQRLNDYEAQIDAAGLREAPDESLNVEDHKNTEKQDRLISQTVRDLIKGFFHVDGEYVETDEDGNEFLHWSKESGVEEAITDLMRYFNIRGIEGQRTVFRLVRLYASMSIDRHGKMFNEDSSEWSLSSDEFVMICRLIKRSCQENGHPLSIVSDTAELRGTSIFPCGVMPKVVAKAICNPGSNLQMSPAECVQACQDEWTTKTLPDMRRTLVDEKIGQLVVIQDMARAVSMLDGMTAERFSERYNVSTTLDFHLSEYQDSLKAYAVAMNNSVDAQAVKAREERKIDQYRKLYDDQRHMSMVKDHEGINHPVQNKERTWISGLKFFNKLTRSSGVALYIPVTVSAFMEKGLGNVRTNIALWAMGSNYEVSDYTNERLRSDESVEAFQCVKQLYDSFGPGAVRLFEESGMEYTKENVAQFARENLQSLTSVGIERANQILDRLTHNLLTADYAFRRSDVDLWFKAYLASNKAAADVQEKLAQEGRLSDREIPLTANEIDGMVRSYTSMGQFFAEAMGSDYGINAYNMMKANNIGQTSPWSYTVDRFLRDHAVTDTVITQFVDTYPRYGMNFIYMLVPFSRTMSYINYKMNDSTNDIKADYIIGGNYEDFTTGLRMNLIYDAMNFGHSFIIGGIIGVILNTLGWEPPDDDQNYYNASMWKIGGKVGLGEDYDGDGKGDGVELQLAWWMNDLTLLQMPVATFTATWLSTGDLDLSKQLMFSSLHDTVDGNVLLDFADTVNNFRENYVEFNEMINDPAYNGPKDVYSYAVMEAQQYSLSLLMGKKWNPINPLINMINRDTFFQGNSARNRAFNKVFDKSDEWHIQNGATTKTSYDDYLRRKYTSSNLLYAALCNKFINQGDEKKTGYFWWEMPVRTMQDNLACAWAGEFAVDYNKRAEGQSVQQYEEEVANKVLSYIESFGSVQEAQEAGFIIPTKARKITLDVLFSRRNSLDNEWAARLESGELDRYLDRQPEYQRYADERQRINTIIFDWLKSDDIPEWEEGYEQLLTDYEVSYRYKDSGLPAPETEMFNPNVEPVYLPKGNHPTSFAPFTLVDQSSNEEVQRGFNAETKNSWQNDHTDFDAIFNGIGQNELKIGRDAGMILNDSLFGKQLLIDEFKAKLRNEATINYRSYVPKKVTLSDEIRDYDEKAATGGVLGDNGKYSQDAQDVINGTKKTPTSSNYPTYWSRSTYGYSSGGGGGGSYGNYNPKIYSNPRQVNSDRAATMYTKQPYGNTPTSYLRPSFSTKGSREAYKRQDM